MTTAQKSQIKQHPHNYDSSSKDNYCVEITAKDVTNAFEQQKYTWIYFWVPYCKDTVCKPLFYYDLIINKFRKKSAELYLISQIYDFNVLKQQSSNFSNNIYTLKDDYYGHNMYRSRRLFTNELLDGNPISKFTPSHLVFKNDSLIYYGVHISSQIMDSVLNANP